MTTSEEQKAAEKYKAEDTKKGNGFYYTSGRVAAHLDGQRVGYEKALELAEKWLWEESQSEPDLGQENKGRYKFGPPSADALIVYLKSLLVAPSEGSGE